MRATRRGFLGRAAAAALAAPVIVCSSALGVERLGGRLAIESRPGCGTAVRVTVLLRDYDADMGEAG